MTGLLRRLDGWWAAREQRRAVAVLAERLGRLPVHRVDGRLEHRRRTGIPTWRTR